MRRICGLSSQIRNRSLLKSMRNMAGPRGRTWRKRYPGVNHIAAPVNEWLQKQGAKRVRAIQISRPGARPGAVGASISELLAQNAFFQAVAGVEQHPHR